MKGLLADLRHALRLYWRTPAASLIAVGVLAVGMAFVVAFVSLYVDLVLRPHPGFENGRRIVTIDQTNGRQFGGLPVALIDRISDEATSLEAAAGVISTGLRTPDGGDPIRLELVTRDYFEKLQPRVYSGRGFTLEDHDKDSAPVAVISYRYWRDKLEGRDVLGTRLNIDIEPMLSLTNRGQKPEEPETTFSDFRIVGIMAPEMTGTLSDGTQIWFPFERAIPLLLRGPSLDELRRQLTLQTLGVKRKGSSTAAVITEIGSRYGDLDEDFRVQPGFHIDAIDGAVRDINVQRDSKRQLQLFLAASVLLAIVAAANVSLFLLARAPGRRRELAIRLAVGAPLKRIARQLASEAGLLVVVSALIGMLVSVWLSSFLRGLAFLRQADWRDVSLLDWRVLGFVGLLLLVLTVLVSLTPILGLGRVGIAATSRYVAARATPAQRIAGTLQIAIAGALGGAAIAFGWHLASMTFGDPGYTTENRYVAQYSINTTNLTADRARSLFESNLVDLDRRREAIEAIPGVSAVAFGRPVPGMN